jgi:O-antigen ligase
VTTATIPAMTPALDLGAVRRWPITAAAHLLGLGLVLATLMALPVAPSDLDRHQFPKETLLHLGVFLAVLLARPWPPQGVRRATWVGVVALALWSVAATVAATNPWLALRATSLTITSLAALITARHLAALGAGAILLGWAATAAVLGAATGLLQALGVEHVFFNELRAPGGTFGNRNFLAHVAAATLPLLAYLILTVRRTVALTLPALGVACCAAALVLTRSRAGWLAAIVGIGVATAALLYARWRVGVPLRNGRVLLLGLMVPAGIAAAMVLPNTLEWRSDSPYTDTLGNLANYREGSGRGRLLQYQNSLELARRHPVFGVGPGNWALHYGEVAPRGDPSFARNDVVPLNPWPSSDWVAILSERGVVGVLAAILLGASLLWRAMLGIRSGGDRALGGAALVGTIGAIGMAGLFDAVLLLAVPAGFAAVAMGALLSRADGEANDVPSSPGYRARGASLMLVLLATGLVRSTMQTTAYILAGNGGSRSRLERAVLIDPFSYQLQIRLARGPCRQARPHAAAAVKLAPTWPAARAAARRCGVEVAQAPRRDR